MGIFIWNILKAIRVNSLIIKLKDMLCINYVKFEFLLKMSTFSNKENLKVFWDFKRKWTHEIKKTKTFKKKMKYLIHFYAKMCTLRSMFKKYLKPDWKIRKIFKTVSEQNIRLE